MGSRMKIVVPGGSVRLALLLLGNTLVEGASGLAPTLMTVTGPVEASQLGVVLSHEHIMSTFGAEPAVTPNYDEAAVLAAVVPALETLRSAGVGTIIEGTAAYFGRDPRLLRRIAGQTGMHVVTNTGYYGAANGRYLPPELASLTVEELAARWTALRLQNGYAATKQLKRWISIPSPAAMATSLRKPG